MAFRWKLGDPVGGGGEGKLGGMLGDIFGGIGGFGAAISTLQTLGGLFTKKKGIPRAKVSSATTQAVASAKRNASLTKSPTSAIAETRIDQATSNAQSNLKRSSTQASRVLAGNAILNKQRHNALLGVSAQDAQFRQGQQDRLTSAQFRLGQEQQQADNINRGISLQQNAAKQDLIGAGFKSLTNAAQDRESANVLSGALGLDTTQIGLLSGLFGRRRGL